MSALLESVLAQREKKSDRLSIGKTMTASAVAVFASMLLASAPLAVQGFVASPAGTTVAALRQGNVQLVGRRSTGAVASSSSSSR